MPSSRDQTVSSDTGVWSSIPRYCFPIFLDLAHEVSVDFRNYYHLSCPLAWLYGGSFVASYRIATLCLRHNDISPLIRFWFSRNDSARKQSLVMRCFLLARRQLVLPGNSLVLSLMSKNALSLIFFLDLIHTALCSITLLIQRSDLSSKFLDFWVSHKCVAVNPELATNKRRWSVFWEVSESEHITWLY